MQSILTFVMFHFILTYPSREGNRTKGRKPLKQLTMLIFHQVFCFCYGKRETKKCLVCVIVKRKTTKGKNSSSLVWSDPNAATTKVPILFTRTEWGHFHGKKSQIGLGLYLHGAFGLSPLKGNLRCHGKNPSKHRVSGGESFVVLCISPLWNIDGCFNLSLC